MADDSEWCTTATVVDDVDVVLARVVVVAAIDAGDGTYETVGLVMVVGEGRSVVVVTRAVVVVVAMVVVGELPVSARALDSPASVGNSTATTIAPALQQMAEN